MPQISQEQGVSVILRRPLLITKTLTLEPAFPPVYTHTLSFMPHTYPHWVHCRRRGRCGRGRLPGPSDLRQLNSSYSHGSWLCWSCKERCCCCCCSCRCWRCHSVIAGTPPCRDAPLQRQMQVLWAGSDSDSDSGTGAAAGCRQSWVAWASGCCHSSWPAMSCCRCWAWGLA